MQTWNPLDPKVPDARGLVLGAWVLRLKGTDRRVKLARVILTMRDKPRGMRFLRVKTCFAHEGMGDSRVIGGSERREVLDRGIGKICDWRDPAVDLQT